MPKKPIDYSKTIIYKLVCKDLDVKDLYVGHTTNWKQRKKCHKNNCNNISSKSYNLKVYNMMRENGGLDNWEMVEIEKYPCNDEREASARERYWYEQLHAELNMVNPYRTEEERKEYRKKQNKEYYKTYYFKFGVKNHKSKMNKEWYEKNKEKISLRRKQKITCSCGSEFRKSDIKQHERTKKHQQYIESLN